MGSDIHTAPPFPESAGQATVRVNVTDRFAVAPVCPSSSDTPLPIRTLGDYELVRPLGRGGMGVVYLARQRRLNRNVAYKVMTYLGCLNPEALIRFRGEAETLAKLHHPGIVQVYDTGFENGVPFLAMEYVSGGSLHDLVRNGRPTALDAARLIAPVAAAVGHAHASGIIHRDLKPDNILLTTEGCPKVADFGLARHLADEHLTRTGMTAGTPTYMPPEQLAGDKGLTPAVDVWALGVILYELLTGTTPFTGEEPQQILTDVMLRDPMSLRAWQPNLPRDLETICLKCLRKEPDQRYATGTELADDLVRFLNDQPILARPVGAAERGARWCRRNPLSAGLTAIVGVTLVFAAAISLTFAARAHRDRAHAVAAARAQADLRVRAERAAAQETEARREAEAAAARERAARHEAEAMTEMLHRILASARPGNDEGAMVALRRELNATVQKLTAGTERPLLRAGLLFTLSMTQRSLGDFADAIAPMEVALALRSEHLGQDHDLTRQTARELSYAYVHVHRGADAVRVLKPVAEAVAASEPADSPTVLSYFTMLRNAYGVAGQTAEEDALGARIVSLLAQRYGDDHVATVWARVNQRQYTSPPPHSDETVRGLTMALAKFRAALPPHSTEIVWTRARLGWVLLESGRPADAVPLLAESYDYELRVRGFAHPHNLTLADALATAYERCQRFAEASPIRRELQNHYRTVGDTTRADRNAERLTTDEAAAAGRGAAHPPSGSSKRPGDAISKRG